jgi:hypothetical protein
LAAPSLTQSPTIGQSHVRLRQGAIDTDDPTRAVLDVLTAMKAESEIATTRAYAMTATAQCREARARHGRGRYSLCTGDVGLAVYLRDCMSGEPLFPTVDVF